MSSPPLPICEPSSTDQFMEVHGNLSLENLEIRNGFGGPGNVYPLFNIRPGSFTNLTDVVIRDFDASDNGVVYGQEGSGSWTRVSFINITSSTAALFFVQDLNWRFEDMLFENCYGKMTSLQLLLFSTWIFDCNVQFAGTINFTNCGTDSTVDDMTYLPDLIEMWVNKHDEHSNASVIVTSDPLKPSHFIFNNITASRYFSLFGDQLGSIELEIGSVEVKNAQLYMTADPVASGQYEIPYIFSMGSYGYNNQTRMVLKVLGSIESENIPVMGAYNETRFTGPSQTPTPPFEFYVGGSITATVAAPPSYELLTGAMPTSTDTEYDSFLPQSFPAFAFFYPTNFHVVGPVNITLIPNYQFPNYQNQQAQITNAITVGSGGPDKPVHVNFLFDSSLYISSSSTFGNRFNASFSAITIANAGASLNLMGGSSTQILSHSTYNFSGGAIHVAESASLSIDSPNIIFQNNVAHIEDAANGKGGRGGAIFASFSSQLHLTTSSSFTFDSNSASYGGALYIEAPSSSVNFPVSGQTSFISNSALIAGGALFIDTSMSQLFSTARFTSNHAGVHSCVVAFDELASSTSHCPSQSFLFESGSGSNYRDNTGTYLNSSCAIAETLCQQFGPPASPLAVPSPHYPVAVDTPPVGCAGIPPATSSCINGNWVILAAQLEQQLANNPNTVIEAPLVITGNFTAPSLRITKLSSSTGGDGSSRAFIYSESCITLNTLQVELTDEDVKSVEEAPKSKRDINLLESSCPPTAVLSIEGQKPKQKCKKFESTEARTNTNLSVTFRVNSSKCNVWWIVLASVLGGVALLLAIAFIIFKTVPKFRTKVQPFFKANT
jgi:hypothetical protein